MIALVRGEVILRRPDYIVVDTGGVGYRLAVSANTLKHVPAAGSETTLHTHLVMRDDAIALFGFVSEDERELFLMLIGVQSVGPKVALAVLSGGTPRELTAALARGDAARFQAVPGIGKRTAERIIVELREKAGEIGQTDGVSLPTGDVTDDPHFVARDGLMGLGFSLPEAEELLSAAEGQSAEQLIESALKVSRA